MIDLIDLTMLVPFVLYAETHYRFKYFFSYLRKPEPEVIFDTPHRIEPSSPLPVLLLVKDAHLYPSNIVSISASLSQGGVVRIRQTLLQDPMSVKQKLEWRMFELDRGDLRGWVDLDINFDLRRGTRTKTYRNDNHRTSSHRALRIFLSPHPLPRPDGVYYGDAHTHSSYTDDQVEFGAPLEPSIGLARSIGLSFFCATDHSYDLDDRIDTYLKNDPGIPKWKAFQEEVSHLNDQYGDPAILRGEEVTCRNSRGQNVHLLLFGNKGFVPGSGDSAERWFHTRSEHSVVEVLGSKEDAVAAFAAHPREAIPFLQRFLIGRGRWEHHDLADQRLTGMQFANGTLHDGYQEGKACWVQLLLGGRKLKIVGGNDSHGNFNRFRQIGLPFVRIAERSTQIFGKMRTGLLSNDRPSEKTFLNAMLAGSCFVTNGPHCAISLINESGVPTAMGGTARGKSLTCTIRILSTEEFGFLDQFRLYQGFIGTGNEQLLWEKTKISMYQFEESIQVPSPGASYIRAELSTEPESSLTGESHFALTNPIWINT